MRQSFDCLDHIRFEHQFLARFQPVTIVSLLATLGFIFAFQAENITTRWLAVVLRVPRKIVSCWLGPSSIPVQHSSQPATLASTS